MELSRSQNRAAPSPLFGATRTPFRTRDVNRGSAAGHSSYASPVIPSLLDVSSPVPYGYGSPTSPDFRKVYPIAPQSPSFFGPSFTVESPSFIPPYNFQSGPLTCRPAPSPLFQCNGRTPRSSRSEASRSLARLSLSQSTFNNESLDASSSQLGADRAACVRQSTLPKWTIDPLTNQVIVPLSVVLEHGLLKNFATDKIGKRFLKEHYPPVDSPDRNVLVDEVLSSAELFHDLCTDVFGNFFVQDMIANATPYEFAAISDLLVRNDIFAMCLNQYACRVVQAIVQFSKMPPLGILCELQQCDLALLSTDQNANHVIQRIMKSFPLSSWSFLLEYFAVQGEHLLQVAENKYGCRIVQLAIEILAKERGNPLADGLTADIMCIMLLNCERMSVHEFANYVIQDIFHQPSLAYYRDTIISKCIIGNVLSLSQEKYASHVVEMAMRCAPPNLVKDLVNELFDGYLPHPETKKQAVEILLFHQYGNYVIQGIMLICKDSVEQFRSGFIVTDFKLHREWLRRLWVLIQSCSRRLSRYNSGIKIIDLFEKIVERDDETSRYIQGSSHSGRYAQPIRR